MRTYRHILTVIDLTPSGRLMLRRASHLARLCHAQLLVAHVVDYSTGYESDHVPFRTTPEMQAELARAAEQKLREWIECQDGRIEVRVPVGDPPREVMRLIAAWEPDLAIVGSQAPHGLQNKFSLPASCDVLMVQPDGPYVGGHLLRGLTAPLARLWGLTFGAWA